MSKTDEKCEKISNILVDPGWEETWDVSGQSGFLAFGALAP